MQVKDLDFIEAKIIPKIEKYVDHMARFSAELVQNALDNAAAEAAKEEAKARGEAGLAKVTKKALTRPMSPKITQPKPPILPEPEKIATEIKAKDVPSFINNNTLEKINQKRQHDKDMIKNQTLGKYSPEQQFKFHNTKSGRPIEEIKREIEEEREKELKFNSSFYNPPPVFSRTDAEFRDNTAAILREDSLYRKQQAKDAQILRNYEEELRDPTEYFLWQKEMKDRDETEKLKHVALRREQAKQSAEEAKLALLKQKEDNLHIASMVREQGDVIKRQMELEREIEILSKQEIVQNVIAVRETKPLEAIEKSLQERTEKGKLVREELERVRLLKEAEDRLEEERKADKIRQLRALNTVHKKHIVMFDPTETAGIGLLDEMSYMEMKERQKIERQKQEEKTHIKREEIIEQKTKKQMDLERRAEAILRARQLKAEANQQMRSQEKSRRIKEKNDIESARKTAELIWEKELSERQAAKQAERDALREEEERIKRQQQYLGAAQGQVAAMREHQIQMARDRQVQQLQEEFETLMKHEEETKIKEQKNKIVLHRRERAAQDEIEQDRAEQFAFEKQSSIQKIKGDVIYKKNMFVEGQQQHERTKTVLYETNPYGARISQEIRTNATSRRKAMLESM